MDRRTSLGNRWREYLCVVAKHLQSEIVSRFGHLRFNSSCTHEKTKGHSKKKTLALTLKKKYFLYIFFSSVTPVTRVTRVALEKKMYIFFIFFM